MILLIIWLLCGIWASSVASGKGRNGLSWFIGGCIFGVFAVVAAYMSDPIKKIK